MLRRLTQFAALSVCIASLPSCVNAQRGVGASVPTAVAPRAMAMPVAAPTMHAMPARVAVGARVPAHVGAASGSHPVAPHHPMKPAAPRPPARNYPVSSNPGYTNAPFPNQGFDDGGYPVPGLGFDYVHYAAVHPGVYRHQFHGGGLVPYAGGAGIYVPIEYYAQPVAAVEQPAVSDVDSEEGQVEAEQPETYTAPPVSAPRRERTVSSTPLPPSPEYIFVRRDGTVFFAVGYSWSNGSLQYVTQDGLRKVAPLTTLDLDATSQFNEQRGLSFRSPA